MSFSPVENLKIVRLLGYPGLSLSPNSILYTNWIDVRLSGATPEMESCVRDLLNRVLKMDEKLEKAICRAGVSSIDGITFRENEISMIRRERCRVISEISSILDIPSSSCSSIGNVCL